MTDREKFLERWSRRKRAAADAASPPRAQHVQQPPADESPPAQSTAPAQRGTAEPQRPLPAAPEFDLTKLPSLDSITSATDVRAFLMPGVPQHLTRAALRRAWAADPAIRDFVGLQDYDWDFVTPGAIPGFADLPADHDVREMLSQVLREKGEPSAKAERADDIPARARTDILPPEMQHPENAGEESIFQLPGGDVAAGEGDGTGQPVTTNWPHEVEPKLIPNSIVQCENIAASQHSVAEDEPEKSMPPRKHGGALPK
jgi:hypothetical protein